MWSGWWAATDKKRLVATWRRKTVPCASTTLFFLALCCSLIKEITEQRSLNCRNRIVKIKRRILISAKHYWAFEKKRDERMDWRTSWWISLLWWFLLAHKRKYSALNKSDLKSSFAEERTSVQNQARRSDQRLK